MIYAIKGNDERLVDVLSQNSEKGELNNALQDRAGKNAAHFVVNPVEFGSYENLQLLEKLHGLRYDLQCKDKQGREPLDYAREQQSGKLRSKLAQLTGRQEELMGETGQIVSAVAVEAWPEVPVDFEKDSELLLQEAEEKEGNELKDAEKLKQLVPVDTTGNFEKSYSVYCEGSRPWDAYLTKVDLKNGVYGDYVFYKIQLLYDTVRDLYVVFTRYGRIGEPGMNQRTPFDSIEAAKKEFSSIFKSKTGNECTGDAAAFVRVPKKYALTQVVYRSVAHQDYLAPFSFEKSPNSKLGADTRELLEEISNITMYRKAMTNLGLDTEALPISGLSKETLGKAGDILKSLGALAKEDARITAQGMRANLDELREVRGKLSDLSSRFYELIPLARYKD